MIFINYRIDDSNSQADRLATDLKKHLADDDKAVFRDKSGIEGGEQWPKVLEEALKHCRVMLVLIGPLWDQVKVKEGDRKGYLRLLLKRDDWVWREIRFALDTGKVIIPILVKNATMPPKGWMTGIGLGELADLQALPLREDGDWDGDLRKIVERIHKELPESTKLLDTILASASEQGLRDWNEGPVAVVEPAGDKLVTPPRRPARPPRYIEPHLGELLPEIEATDSTEDRLRHAPEKLDRTTRYQPLLSDDERAAVTDDSQQTVADRELTKLFSLGRRLCLAEDANSGKTIFSHRVRAFLCSAAGQNACFQGRPALVCRWENTALSRHWPTDGEQLLDELAKAVEPWCPTSKGSEPQNAQKVVAEALAEGRVALILDAVDQAGDPSRLLNFLNTDPRFLNVPVLITGRSFAFRAQTDSTLFPRTGYKFITLLPFDENQQGRMLADVCPQGGDFRQLFANYADVQELLGVVGMLAMVRELAGEEVGDSRRAGALTRLRTRCDFYYQFYRRKMLQAARKPTDLREHALTDLTEREPRWHKMLAVTAFRMVLEGATSYSVAGNVAGYVQDDVRRYLKELDNIEVRDDDWASLRRFSVLSDYSVLEGRSEGVFSWRHKGWLEYFCGVFLACYADPAALAKFDFDLIQPRRRRDDATAASPDPLGFQGVDADRFRNDNDGLFREVMTQLTNDPQWKWGWRFAAEIPRIPVDADDRAPFHPRRLRDSLANLFRVPARGLRPTELIYEAFYLFETDEHTPPDRCGYTDVLKDPAGVLAEYRASGTPLVKADEPSEVLLYPTRTDSPLVNRKINAEFVLCPPKGGVSVFKQGSVTGKGAKDEQPRHPVRVAPIRMQTCLVTRGQYRCFDGALEKEPATPGWTSSSIASLIERASGADHCPAILVSWFDSWAFARWLGPDYRLPTESEWEFACRAGGENDYTFGSSETKLKEYAWFGSNSGNRTHPVAEKRPNGWGLFDVHGNVWEWCQDWFNVEWYRERIRTHLISERRLPAEEVGKLSLDELVSALGGDDLTADAGPAAGSSRVLRGGSWFGIARACRSAVRFHFAPEYRRYDIGFRVCRGGESEVARRPQD